MPQGIKTQSVIWQTKMPLALWWYPAWSGMIPKYSSSYSDDKSAQRPESYHNLALIGV